MGGAAGHLNHVHEDVNLTFQELKDIIVRALDGRLDYKGAPVEKIDGYNLYITFQDGVIKVARNKSTILNPLSNADIQEKFNDDTNAFGISLNTIEHLQTVFDEFPKEFLYEVFLNGKRFLSTEVVLKDYQNIIPYKIGPFIVFHALVQYDSQGNLTGYSTKAARTFYRLLQEAKLTKNDYLNILPQKIIKLKPSKNAFEHQQILFTLLNKLQREYNLQDSDTLNSYYIKWWTNFITNMFSDLSESLKIHLINRWALGDKSFRIYSKYFENKQIFEKVKDIDSNFVKNYQDENYEKFEIIFLMLGAIVLSNQDDFLSQESSYLFQKSVQEKITELKSTVKEPIKLKKAIKLLKKIKACGGLGSLVPCEGLIFYYKNNPYKLTGQFASLNRLLNLQKKSY